MAKNSKLTLVIKTGALGDVIRTQYFAESIFKSGKRLWWYTSPQAAALISHNPFIDKVVIDPKELQGQRFETVFSLDDELELIDLACSLLSEKIEGLFHSEGHVYYTENTSAWNHMGILSQLGKEQADSLKKLNQRSHTNIFADIFNVAAENVTPRIYYPIEKILQARRWLERSCRAQGPLILVNFSAGTRWKSKSLPTYQAEKFFAKVDAISKLANVQYLMAYDDTSKEYIDELRPRLCKSIDILFIDTTANIYLLSSLVKLCSIVVTTDSLIMHLAIAQGVRTIAIFISTSSVEIDSFGVLDKILAKGPDVCSYKPTISAETSIDVEELVEVFNKRLSALHIM